MFHRDTLRLIKKTANRFISLFLIVFIGVAFMAGLMATPDIMKKSVDRYYDEYHLMDVQLYSAYGFCDEDITAIEKGEAVETVFASRFADVYALNEQGDYYVTRLQEMDSDVNTIELTKGRMPQNKNEALCLQTSSFGAVYDIGDRIVVEREDLEDFSTSNEFEIVGYCKAPQYMSMSKETSTLDNKALEVILYVQNDVLISKYYTSIFMTLKGLEDFSAYSDEYESAKDELLPSIKSAAKRQENYLKDDLIAEAYKEIEDGQKELDEKLQEANAEIEKGEAELEDAHIQLIIGETQIKTNLKQIEAGEKEIEANQKLLDEGKQKIDEGIQLIETETGMSFDEAYMSIEGTYTTYMALKNQLGNTSQTVEEAKAEKVRLEAEIAQNELLIAEKEALIASLDPVNDAEQIETLEDEIEALELMNQSYQSTINGLNLIIEDYNDENIQNTLDEMDAMAGGSVEESYYQMTLLKESKEEIEAGYLELEKGRQELEAGKALILEAQKELESGRRAYNQGKKDLDEAKKTLNDEVEKAKAEIAKAKQDIAELPAASWMVLDRSMHYSPYLYEGTIDQMTAICITVPFMFYLVAALVCMTTMTRLIDEQRSQLGLFSALGFSKGQIISKYLIYALIATISASVLAVPSGILLFPRVIYEVWRLMYDLPPMHFFIPFLPTLFCLFAFTVLMLLVSYYVAHRSLDENPAQLLRLKAPKNAKKVFLEKIGFIWKRLSFTSKITARNLIRYKTRFFMTVIGVAGCTGLLVLGYGIKDCISDIIHLQFEEIFKYNVTVNLENDHQLDSIVEKLKKDYQNEEIVPFMSYTSKVYLDEADKTIEVHVYDAREIKDVMNLKERRSQKPLRIDGDGIVISEKFAKNNGLKVGDSITLESKEGIKADVQIAGICELYFQHYAFMSNDNYELLFDEAIHPNNIAVYTEDINTLSKSIEEEESVISLVDFKPMISNFETMLQALDLIILVIILAAGSLALVVLMNLTQVNISERIREIATLKVLGFRTHEVYSYIFKEIVLLSMIGGLFGLPLGKAMHSFIMSVIDMEMVMFGKNITLFSYGISFAITMTFTFLVLLVMRKSLKDIEMVESLKSIE